MEIDTTAPSTPSKERMPGTFIIKTTTYQPPKVEDTDDSFLFTRTLRRNTTPPLPTTILKNTRANLKSTGKTDAITEFIMAGGLTKTSLTLHDYGLGPNVGIRMEDPDRLYLVPDTKVEQLGT